MFSYHPLCSPGGSGTYFSDVQSFNAQNSCEKLSTVVQLSVISAFLKGNRQRRQENLQFSGQLAWITVLKRPRLKVGRQGPVLNSHEIVNDHIDGRFWESFCSYFVFEMLDEIWSILLLIRSLNFHDNSTESFPKLNNLPPSLGEDKPSLSSIPIMLLPCSGDTSAKSIISYQHLTWNFHRAYQGT